MGRGETIAGRGVVTPRRARICRNPTRAGNLGTHPIPRRVEGSAILSLVTQPAAPILAILDGHGIIHRAYHAFKEPLTVRRTGEVVSAVYGMTNTLLTMFEEVRPTYVAMAMDLGRPKRLERLESYKAQRPETSPELVSQFKRCRQIVRAFDIPIYEAEGWEADDILGTLARQAKALDVEVYLVSLDSDIAQLVEPGVKLYMYRLYQRDTVTYDEEGVLERYGVAPARIADLKALKGDTSDNIPGVPGIGDKTAAKLVQQFGSVDGVYENLELVQPARIRELLRQHRDQAYLSRELATIERDAPVTLDIEACRLHAYDRQKVVELLRELEFRSLIDRLPEPERAEAAPESRQLALGEAPPEAPGEGYGVVQTLDQLDELTADLRLAGRFALDAVSSTDRPLMGGIVGVAFATDRGSCYLPIGHSAGDEVQLPLDAVRDRLRPILADLSILKIAHDAKHDIEVLANEGLWTEGVDFDTMIAAFLLGAGSLGVDSAEGEGTRSRGASSLTTKALAFDRLHFEIPELASLIGSGVRRISMADTPVGAAARVMTAQVAATWRLRDVFQRELNEQDQWKLFSEIEMPLVPVLTRMELTGIALDVGELREMAVELSAELKRIERAIYDEVGHEFNIGSPQQLSDVLFSELRLPRSRRTKHGYTTDAATLESLRGMHQVPDLILEHRQLGKIKSTYVDALPGLVNPRTGRVHTTYNQTGAATGRFSSSDPNLQNIPIRTELGRRVRRAFVARGLEPDPHLVAADYSQIELRVMAHYSQDEGLLEAFRRGEDIHTSTAAQVMGVEPSQVTPEMRRLAKVVNFGLIYGLSEFGLASRTDLSREEAAAFIQTYFARFPRVKEYISHTIETTRRRGYAETLTGRRRYIPEINSPNGQVRQAAERMAINMPIQGAAADVIKIAMVQVQGEMDQRKLRSRMLLQVHDELVFECPSTEIEEMKSLVSEIMPAALNLSVPLKVDLKLGRNWGEME